MIRSSNLYDEIHKLKILHGSLSSWIFPDRLYKVPTVSKDIKVVIITNQDRCSILQQYKNNTDNISLHTIVLTEFKCWIDKILPIIKYIQTISEPYVMYLDARDTIIIDDITDPQDILSSYNCKLLFNAEDGSSHPGHPCDKKLWLYPEYYNSIRLNEVNINKQRLYAKTGISKYTRSLNAGVYLGERQFLIECLESILSLMLDDPIKKYPYGESDDQILWQRLMALNSSEEIQIDYKNLYFLWGGVRHLEYPADHWENFNYFNSFSKNL